MRLILPRPKPKGLVFDFVLEIVLVAAGDGGVAFGAFARGAPEDVDCWSVMEWAGVSSAEVASDSGRGGGGETLFRG